VGESGVGGSPLQVVGRAPSHPTSFLFFSTHAPPAKPRPLRAFSHMDRSPLLRDGGVGDVAAANNQREWSDLANWSSLGLFYFSRRDTRLWVPKQPTKLFFGSPVSLGWTVNVGHPWGDVAFLGATVALPTFLATIAVVSGLTVAGAKSR
jgi:hypothetical protein